MKRSLKWILIVLVALGAIGGIVGYQLYNKAPEKVEDIKGTEVSADVLINDYAQDETVANGKYLNKALEVKGSVTEVTKNQDGAVVVTIAGTNNVMAIQCTMRDKEVNLEKGTTVTVKGFCSGNTMFDVLLTDCVVKG
jgi:anionic cell wall polymer biosynthesis LytR-Cps2A-Psr (LCP) family protein